MTGRDVVANAAIRLPNRLVALVFRRQGAAVCQATSANIVLLWSDPMELQSGLAFNDGAAPDAPAPDNVIATDIPARLDALTWSGFHTRVVIALGITWVLDGLEVTLAGALSGALKQSPVLH